ncbi:MAG TPA: GGDEF domain-containing protein, partial [Nevskiaceae bacterium]|nr:GGDEF domain-containing protein [Nevskiaceae bacterium]
DGAASWRPAPQSAATLLLLNVAMLLGGSSRRSERFDVGDLVTLLGTLLPFAVLLGYLLDATELYQGGSLGGGASPMAALLLLVLAFGQISLYPRRGLLSAFTTPTAGAAVGRRLLPWVMLLPVLFGCMQVWVVKVELMTLPLAVASTVTISIIAFIYLIYRVSNLMTQLEAQQAEEHVQRESAAKEEGMTDALTGLLNRRGWEKHLRLEEERCKRHGHNGCIVMIDLDDLKKVNDTQGHSQGDELIKRAGQALLSGARRGDVLARLGGDEFAYLAIGCQPEHAGVVVRRLAEALMNAKVGASLGYALRDINVNLQGAFDEADRSMYANKRARKAKRVAEAAN